MGRDLWLVADQHSPLNPAKPSQLYTAPHLCKVCEGPGAQCANQLSRRHRPRPASAGMGSPGAGKTIRHKHPTLRNMGRNTRGNTRRNTPAIFRNIAAITKKQLSNQQLTNISRDANMRTAIGTHIAKNLADELLGPRRRLPIERSTHLERAYDDLCNTILRHRHRPTDNLPARSVQHGPCSRRCDCGHDWSCCPFPDFLRRPDHSRRPSHGSASRQPAANRRQDHCSARRLGPGLVHGQ